MLSTLNHNSAKKILELGKLLHEESKFKDTPFNEEKCWNVLNATQTDPNYFITYETHFYGFLILKATTHYFNDIKWVADLAFYVRHEYRGTTIAIRLLEAGEEWAKSIGADEMTIFHNTGINTDKSEKFFNRNGFNTAGYIFTKDLKNVRNC